MLLIRVIFATCALRNERCVRYAKYGRNVLYRPNDAYADALASRIGELLQVDVVPSAPIQEQRINAAKSRYQAAVEQLIGAMQKTALRHPRRPSYR